MMKLKRNRQYSKNSSIFCLLFYVFGKMLTRRRAFVQSIWRKWINWIILVPSHHLKNPFRWMNYTQQPRIMLNEFYLLHTVIEFGSFGILWQLCMRRTYSSNIILTVCSTFACVFRSTVFHIQRNRHRTIRYPFEYTLIRKVCRIIHTQSVYK